MPMRSKQDIERVLVSGVKICGGCSKSLPTSCFSKLLRSPDGLDGKCRECRSENTKRIKSLDPERYRKYARKAEKKYRSTPHGHLSFWVGASMSKHRKRGYVFLFKKQELLDKIKDIKDCQFCGATLAWKHGNGCTDSSPSMENLNCLRELTLSDVTIICSKCNRIKSNNTLEEFFNYCQFIIDNREIIKNRVYQQ